MILRMMGAMALGEQVLAPPAAFDAAACLAGLMVHVMLSLLFASLLAWITHRWGLITGIILGGFFGWALYLINIYTLTMVFPWFIMMKHPAFLAAHVIFGMTAGGVYELLEVDESECIERDTRSG